MNSSFRLALFVALAASPAVAQSSNSTAALPQPPIPIRFKLDKPGVVTLVIEDANGNRVRNLVADTKFPDGENTVWWDGFDESVRLPYVEGNSVGPHGIYRVGGRLVAPGKYRVRGLVHDPIKLSYEFTVYPNCANPPWRIPDGSGAWLSDHNPPVDTVFVPATPGVTSEPRVYISAAGAEAGSGVIWTDLNGRKLNGIRWIGGHWTAAEYMTRDEGANPVPNTILYTACGWQSDKNAAVPELRINALRPWGAMEVFKWNPPAVAGQKSAMAKISGLAVHDGLLAAAEATSKKLLFIKVGQNEKRKNEFSSSLLGTTDSGDVRDLAFDASGRLLILSATGLQRVTLPAQLQGEINLAGQENLISTGLEDAHRVTAGPKGELYISDWGNSNQVKVFDAGGKLIRAIGTAGAPQVGPYQTGRMTHPSGMTVLPDGQLWVAEFNLAPKRISVWGADGKFVREMLGPPGYGGGGWLDPADKTRFYLYHGGGMQFKLDWDRGTAQVESIYARPSKGTDSYMGSGPDCPLVLNGSKYLTNAFTSSPTNGTILLGLWKLQDGVTTPVFAAGTTQKLAAEIVAQLGDQLPPAARPTWKQSAPYLFIWSDKNGNAKMDNDEIAISAMPSGIRALAPDRDGNLVVTLYNRVLSFAPKWDRGVPVYDITSPKTVTEGFGIRTSSGNGESVIGNDGWTVVTNGPVEGFENGERKWY